MLKWFSLLTNSRFSCRTWTRNVPLIYNVKWPKPSFFWTDLGWFWPIWLVRVSLPVRAHVINSRPSRFPEIQNWEDVRWIRAGVLQNSDHIAFVCVKSERVFLFCFWLGVIPLPSFSPLSFPSSFLPSISFSLISPFSLSHTIELEHGVQ